MWENKKFPPSFIFGRKKNENDPIWSLVGTENEKDLKRQVLTYA